MRTIDEAANEFCEKRRFNSKGYPPKEWFKAGVEFAQRWIPVEEELPQFLGNPFLILVKSKCDEIHLVYIEDDSDLIDIANDFTHWRPIEIN